MFIAGLSRRTLVAASGAALLSGPARGAQTGRRIATPAQDEGPFYPTAYPSSTDNDLVRLTGSDVPALGTVAHLHGAVTTLDGTPVAGAWVEIWQSDATGKYNHPAQEFVGHRDLRFQGFGVTTTDARGGYAFRALRPVIYEVALGSRRFMRAAHIHVAVYTDGVRRLTTQVYRRGDPYLQHDFIFTRLSDPQKRLVVADFVDGSDMETDALKARFDIILA